MICDIFFVHNGRRLGTASHRISVTLKKESNSPIVLGPISNTEGNSACPKSFQSNKGGEHLALYCGKVRHCVRQGEERRKKEENS